jgi:hypothetical protein
MPSDSDWVLYAPYSEKTLMQNYLAYIWSNRLGQNAVRTRFVEVFMNTAANNKIDYAGDYLGVYILMEKIKVDDDRVDIAKLGPGDTTAPDITGGYIFAKDKPDPGESGFSAAGNDFRYVDPGPLDITPAQKTYLTNYLNEFYSVLNGANFADPVTGYAKYIDVDSFIDQHILTELTKNIDGFRISTYYSKDRNGKIKMGPAWDFNLSLGNADYNNGWIPTGWYYDLLGDYDYPFYRRLFQDPNFQQKYIDRWQEIRRDGFSNQQLNADIDGLVSQLSDGNGNYPVGTNPPQAANNPVVRNFQKWHILGVDTWPNWYTDPSWINQVNWMRDWLRQRVEWWDGQYLGAPTITPPGGAVTQPTQVTITASGSQTFTDTTILSSGAPAKAIVPTGDIGTSWTSRTGFDDSAWTAGTTGVGYDADPPGGGGDYTADLGLLLNMRNINPTAYVRIPFTVSNPASIQQLILKMKFDDGFVAYVNGTEVYRTSNAPAAVDWQSGTSGNATHNATGFEEFDISAFKGALVAGTNVLAIQGLNAGTGSSDLLILPQLISRSVSTTASPVYYTTDGTDPRLPNGTINPNATLYSGPFTVTSTARVMARSKVGTRWSGLASQLYDYGENRLRISEIMYNPAPPAGSSYLPSDFEYVELTNTGTQSMNLAGSRFTNGIDFTFGNYTLAAGARVLVVKNQAAFESRYGTGKPIAGTFTGSLSDGGERVRLLGKFGEVVHDFSYDDDWYPQTDGQGWSLTIVDANGPLTAWGTKAGWRASEPVNGTPGTTDNGVKPNSVVINEVMTNATSGGDWLELRNTTGAGVDIGNWWLSDTPSNLKKYHIPAGTTVPANGYLVFTEAQMGFSFGASGEAVILSSGDAAGNLGGYRVDETFGASDTDVTFGRTLLSTGGSDFTALLSPTRGAANANPRVGPVVINEIMYFPQGTKSEYIELRNLTGAAVPLYDPADTNATWKFTGAIDWAFPSGVSIPANGFVIISAVDPTTFRTQYSVPAGVQVFGPYTLPNGTNVLSNGGESVRLLRPGAAGPVATRPYVEVDHVAYDDDLPWPAETDGTGQSLGRISGGAYGNDPANWAAELFGGSPGKPNLDGVAPTADVLDVTPDPRTAPVPSIGIAFNEAVIGFDLADLRLTRNGSAVPFAGTETLTTGDGGINWTLGNLSTLTSAIGTYVLTVVAAGSGITDAGGRTFNADASDSWVNNTPDTGAPSADIVDVTPDPRNAGVPAISIVFSEPVVGFDRSDLSLKRGASTELLSASHSLATSDGGKTWTLSGLNAVTSLQGMYTLTLKSTGTGITDAAGNPLAGGATEQWVVDTGAPAATITAVIPDPRSTPVSSITITFSESVSGLDLADLRLLRNGGANLLAGAQTLSSPDGGDTWVLDNLTGLTGLSGNYTFRIITAGSGIVDAAGNGLSTVDPAIVWTTDAVAPTVDIIDVTPDPRNTPVGSMVLAFSEPVSGFDIPDLQLSRAGAGGNLLTASQTLTTFDGGLTWSLDNLGPVTAAGGTYTLTLVAGVSGIADLAGNSLPGDATETWTTDVTAPTADIVDVTPDPRNTPVDSITINFSKPVTGVDLADLRLTKEGSAANLLTASQTLTSSDGVTWVLGNLGPVTPAGQGANYTLTLVSAGSGIKDATGNALAADASDDWSEALVVDGWPPDAIYVRGSTWTSAFKTYMAGQGVGDDVYGYRVDDKSAADLVPWVNVDEVVVRYHTAPTGAGIPQPGTVLLDGVRSDYTVTSVAALDPLTYALRLDRPLGNLPDNGGENGDRVRLTLAGAGVGGADYNRTINVLQGDVDKSGSVVASDFSDVKKKFFRSTTAPGPAGDTQYSVYHDVDGSGQIVANDFSEVKKRFFDNLPAAAASVASTGDGTDTTLSGASMTKDLFASTPILA